MANQRHQRRQLRVLPARFLGPLYHGLGVLFWAFVCNGSRSIHTGSSNIVVSASSVPHRHLEQIEAANMVAEVSTYLLSAAYPSLMMQPEYRRSTPQHHDGCVDLRDECEDWKAEGFCEGENHGTYMTYHCARTCQKCHLSTHRRKVPETYAWSPPKQTYDNSGTGKDYQSLQDVVGADTGKAQFIPAHFSPELRQRMISHVGKQRRYLTRKVDREERYQAEREKCKNTQHECTSWALQGECEKNPIYMNQHCPVACFSCHELGGSQTPCQVDPNSKNAWYPGDLNRMFERIVSDPYIVAEYGVKVLSRPSPLSQEVHDNELMMSGHQAPKNSSVPDGPWVIQLDHFFNDTEAERLLQAGSTLDFHRSLEVDENNEDVESDWRTSETSFCNEPACKYDETVRNIQQRIETLTQIPMRNSESLQFLRYKAGSYYRSHNDYIETELDSFQGVRILTVFLYLNTETSGSDDGTLQLTGGATRFNELGMDVRPKRGRAVIWPSVLDENPHEMDPRTFHEALKVVQGQKFGVNAWIHQREHNSECL